MVISEMMSKISTELSMLLAIEEDEVGRLQEGTKLQEDKFKLLLARLSGETSAITIDDMCLFMVFVENNGVHELSFVEEAYKSFIFSDEEFQQTGIIVCSVEQFVSAWEDAKGKKEVAVLKMFRDIHRKARAFLIDPEIKKRIKDYERMRDQHKLNNDYCDLLLNSMRFVRKHLENPATNFLVENAIPQLAALAPSILN